MQELGCKVTVITASAHYLTGEIQRPVKWAWNRRTDRGVTLIETWSPTQYRRNGARRLLCYLSYSLIALLAGCGARNVDVVFTGTDPPFATPSAYLLALRHRARLVLDERDVYPDTAIALGIRSPRVLVSLLSTWNAWLRNRARSIVTVSPGLRRLLLDRGATADKTFVIPNYFPGASQYDVRATGRAGKRRNQFVVLYAGGVGQGTDVFTSLQAACLLQQRGYTDVKFVFQGAGERRDEYKRRAAEIGVSNVEFRATVSRSSMHEVYEQADAAIHLFRRHPYWRCALSSKVFDYMVHGKPVVFAGEGDIADLLHQSGAGIAVPPESPEHLADAIMTLYESPELCDQMGARGKRYVEEHFSRAAIRDQLREALNV